MNKKALSLAICLAMAIPTASNALSLGEIQSKSSLNQPFQGQINLLQTNPSEVQNLRIRVASPEVFNRVGIDRPAFLNNISFRTAVQNGRPVILVNSSQPINEPFLNFLLEVSWPNGQLLKEYTVLLDPPVLLRPNTAIASNNAGVRAEPRVQGRINRAPQPTQQQIQAQRQRQAQQAQRQRQAQQQQRQAAQQRQAQQQRLAQQQARSETAFERQARQVLRGSAPARRVAAAPSRSSSANYRVRRGDTLSTIASRLSQNGVSRDQMMIALFEKNRRAFSQGNINNLKAGVVMARPSVQEARALSSRAAKAQIIAQSRAWKAKRGEQVASTGAAKSSTNKARLEVLGKATKTAANSASSAGSKAAIADLNKKLALLNESLTTKQQENTELKSRVTELESLLRKKNRLIALKSEQLADLQKGLSGEKPNQQQAATPPVANVGNDIQSQVAGQLAQENNQIVRNEPTPSIVDNKPAIANQLATEEPAQEKAADPFKVEESSSSIMDLVTSPVGMGAGLAAILGLGGLFLMRRRKKNDEVEDFSDMIDSGLTDEYSDERYTDDDFVADTFNQDTDEVESEIAFDDTEEETVEAQDDIVTATSEEVVEMGSDDELEDLIQEADVYIVYGLHDQAESEIKRAMMTYPNSAALHAKLLENYKSAGDAEAFEDATKVYLDLDSDDKQNHWEDICEWGNNLLPESKLYDSSSLPAVAAAATGAAMVAGTAVAASTDAVADVDADSLLEDTILDEFDEVDLAKDLDDLEGLDIDTDIELGETKDVADNLADEFDIDLDDDFDTELPDVATSLDDVTETAEAAVSDEVEDTDFLFDDDSLDDLLNADETADSSDDSDDDDSSGLSTMAGLATAGAAAAGLSASGLLDGAKDKLGLDDASGLIDGAKDKLGFSDTSDLMDDAKDKLGINEATNLNLEIDAEDFDKIMPEQHAYKSNSDGETTDLEADENILADVDDNLSFLDLDDDAEVIGETQIETKIDLAKAYIDMGDIDGARSTLEEVMESGNDDQKRQAEELLHQNG